MTDIIFNSGDYETLLADAERLGFTYVNGEGQIEIQITGNLQTGGSYFLNIVGIVYEENNDPDAPDIARPGFWGRLRVNGNVSDLPVFDPKITQYHFYPDLGAWSVDGLTPAPEWVGNVGVIA